MNGKQDDGTQMHTFDRFTVVHAGFGAWAGSRGFGLLPVLLMHTLWEIVECKYHEVYSSDRYVFSPEMMANRIGDTIAAVAGWSLFLTDRLRDDPWIGEINPLRLAWSDGIPRSVVARNR